MTFRLAKQRIQIATSIVWCLVFFAIVCPCEAWGVVSKQNNPFASSRIRRGGVSSELQMERMLVWCDTRHLEDASLLSNNNNLAEDPDAWLLQSGSTNNMLDSPNDENNGALVFQQEGQRLLNSKHATVGVVVELKDAAGQDQALATLGSVEWILVEGAGSSCNDSWQMIPAENLIAAAQSSGTRLAFCVDRASNVGGLARALELGVDALCVASDASPDLWTAVWEARRERNDYAERRTVTLHEELASATPQVLTGSCWRRKTEGTILLADRICVDLVQTLASEEGCWVGSSAKCMALVLSEAASSQFVPTRPFRVNAGPVHSYILLADGTTTKYLCELQAADQVLVYNAATNTSRPVAVGRLKQEVRPCVLVELTIQSNSSMDNKGSMGQVFLQQAETVRLGQAGGKEFVRVTDLDAQHGPIVTEPILLRVTTMGTHVGKAYTGKVEER